MVDFIKLGKGEGVNFTKESLHPITATLRWQEPSVDVDLGCLVKTDQGVTVLQGLGNLFGSFDNDPYAHLNQDARDGGSEEILRVNLTQARHIRRVLVYAYIYNGSIPGRFISKAAKWEGLATATVTVEHPEGTFVIDLANGGNTISCALFELFPDGVGGLQLEPLIDFYPGFQDSMSAHYDSKLPSEERFNINWSRGSK